MNRNVVIAAVVGGLAVLVCVLGIGVIGAGVYVSQRMQSQEAQIAELQATLAVPPATEAPDDSENNTVVTPTSGALPTLDVGDDPTETVEVESTATRVVGVTPTVEETTVPDNDDPSEPPVTVELPPLPEDESVLPRALLPDAQDDFAQASNATLYRISARLDPDTSEVVGRQSVRVTNREGAPLSDLLFRLYANAPYYEEGALEVTNVQVNGQAVTSELESDDTALRVTLPEPLADGATIEVTMDFTTVVPEGGGGYGIFGVADDIWALYGWHPELTVYENGAWVLPPAISQGDLHNTDISHYLAAIEVPSDYVFLSGGSVVNSVEAGDDTVYTVAAPMTRNFVFVTSDQFEQQTATAGDVTVNSYYLPDVAEEGESVLDTAVQSIELFSETFGAYPYAEYDVTQVSLGGGAGGMEATGLVMIGTDLYAPAAGDPLGDIGGLLGGDFESVDVLSFTTAHETAHQWWYNMVGSDSYDDPWLDESLTNWASTYYVEATEGEAAGESALDLFIRMPYQLVLIEGDQVLDQPVDAYDQIDYSSIVYGKGSLMYADLREKMGDDAFFAFLRTYFADHQWQRVHGDDWKATLAESWNQSDADATYTTWVEGDDFTIEDFPEGMMGSLLEDPFLRDLLPGLLEELE